MALPLLPLALAASSYVYGQDLRLDHRGQVSLDVSGLYENLAASGKGPGRSAGLVAVAAGIPLDRSSGQIVIGVRAGAGERFPGSGNAWLSALVSYRGYAGGDEPWKTFLELGVMGQFLPVAGVLARAGAGLQYDTSENLGFFLQAGVAVGGGSGFQIQGDAGLGVQFRFGDPG